MEIKTVFNVESNDDNIAGGYAVNATGQEAVAIVKNGLKRKDRVILQGFLIDGEFKPVDLSSNWQRNATSKKF